MIAMTLDHLSDAVDLNNVRPKSQNHERSLEYESCAFQNRCRCILLMQISLADSRLSRDSRGIEATGPEFTVHDIT